MEKIESKICDHHKGREIKACLFTKLYIKAEGLYKREELRRGGGGTLEALNTGREVTKDKTQILNHIQNYYKDLYTSQRIDDEVIETYLQDTTCIKITSEHGNKCETNVRSLLHRRK